MQKEYEVIIIGSGPAGAACAKALKDQGISCLVVEKEKLPRNKVCSGILFGQTQILINKYFGIQPPEEVYCQPKIIKAENILEWNKEKGFFTYVWELPKDGLKFPKEYLNVRRNSFDYWLLSESGAEFLDNYKFTNYSFENDKIKIEITRNNEKKYIYCSYLIGADGGGSLLRTMIEPTCDEIGPSVVVYQTHCRFSELGSLEDANWYVFRDPKIGEAISAVHRKDEFLTLCVCGFKGRSLKKSMEKFRELLGNNFQVALKDIERDEGCVIKMAPPFLGKGNILLTGEAAGLMYLNGEGISTAIDSGYRAGKAVVSNIKEGGDVMRTYKNGIEDILKHVKLCVEKTRFFS